MDTRIAAGVSIHAFRGEGDLFSAVTTPSINSFNPRLPGGRRLNGNTIRLPKIGFQSTPSGGKATALLKRRAPAVGVSIHAFRGEGDIFGYVVSYHIPLFQSTPSGGKATEREINVYVETKRFNPRLPGGRRRVSQHLLLFD